MATYKTLDLLNRLHEIMDDGYFYVDVYELEGDKEDDLPPSLGFGAIEDEFSTIDYEDVESCEAPEDPSSESITFSPNDPCHQITFTYREISTILCAVDTALEFFKQESKNKANSRETLDNIKTYSVECRNLQAKLNKFFKQFSH